MHYVSERGGRDRAQPNSEQREMAKTNIANVTVEADGFRPAVLWTIGDRKFHVWLELDGVPEDIVHSNPVTPTPGARRDEHRALDRTNKAQSEVWAEVWAIVARDDLLAKARADHAAEIARKQRCTALRQERYDIEQELLSLWRTGRGRADGAEALFERYEAARAELASLGGDDNAS
jgi:hypothetical protein